jgi:NADPH-dependent 2,4-dienoyl-CoA reductase/sulfur reductase-like enzyme/rhodanese-related sulfurtransferase
MKLLIIGGVAGGASAATRARRVNPHAEILILEKGPAVSFANCGLPYHLGGEIEKREKLIVATSELFKKRFGIEVRTLTEAISIDRNLKRVSAINKLTNLEEVYFYDKLIISTGSKLRRLPVFDKSYKNVFSLWSLSDLDQSLDYIKQTNPKKALVVGAGFVGLEIAEQLKYRGLEITVVEKAAQVLGPLDAEMASFIEDELKVNKAALYLGREIKEINSKNEILKSVVLDDGTKLEIDLVFWGIGVLPESKLAEEAALELGALNAIRVNEFQQTSDPDIYAVGDVSEYIYAPTNKKMPVPLAGPANRAGRIAGEHAVSGKTQLKQKVQGTAIVRVFSKTAGLTGLSERSCKAQSIPYLTSYISANNHAGYFPAAKELLIKLVFDPIDGKILGTQIIGEEGVDKRIDIISTLLHFEGSAKDLASLDLAYAPPFGSAKDAVHIAAFTVLNHLDSRPKLISPFANLDTYQVVDVRTSKERENLPLKNSIHIPIDEESGDIRKRLNVLDKTKDTVVVCHSGKRAHIVASMMCDLGFKLVFNSSGGMMIRSRCANSN